jgi:LPXTG-motif cell wall-anchored protein
VQVNPQQGTAGQDVVLSGNGFAPNDGLTATFNSTPVVVATFRANAAGAFSVTVRVPAAATPGPHTFVVTGTSGRSASAPFTVVTTTGPGSPSAPLARTGSSLHDPLALAALLLLLGNAAVLIARRRRIC